MAHNPGDPDVATIVVGNRRYSDWKSVWIQHRWAEDSMLFRFTAVEDSPIPDTWTALQFKPHDEVAIYLGRDLAARGVIITRQTAYDATNHAVQLSGKGITWYAARGSIIHPTNRFDGKNFMQIASEVLQPFGVRPLAVGVPNPTPYPEAHTQPGETLWNFLERLARQHKIVLGSDHLGNLLVIGDHAKVALHHLVEGRNILKMQCIITVEHIYSDVVGHAQSRGDSSKWGPAAAQMWERLKGSAKRYSPILHTVEHPVWSRSELLLRVQAERQWTEGTQITAHVTVQGWQAPDGHIWRAGEHVVVTSPMAMLRGDIMKIAVATFTQDDQGGTLTTLELGIPWLYNASDVMSRDPRSTLPPAPIGEPRAPMTGPTAATDPPPEELPPPGGP
jgi:prophage tail gpP-like protein